MNQNAETPTTPTDLSIPSRRLGHRAAIVLGLGAMLTLGLAVGATLGGNDRGDTDAAGRFESAEAAQEDGERGPSGSEDRNDDGAEASANSNTSNGETANGHTSNANTANGETSNSPWTNDGGSDANSGPEASEFPSPSTPDPTQPTPEPSGPTTTPPNHPPVEIVGPDDGASGPILTLPGGSLPPGLFTPKLVFPDSVQFGTDSTAVITIHNPGGLPVTWTPGSGLRSVTWSPSGTTIQPGASITVKITVTNIPTTPWQRETAISYGGADHPIVLTGGVMFVNPYDPYDPYDYL